MSFVKWLLTAIATVIGVIGLWVAASGQNTLHYTVGFIVFIVALLFIFGMIKFHFDQLERRPQK